MNADPEALAAVHRALREVPHDAPLRATLAELRAAVPYPPGVAPPPPPVGLSPWQLFAAVALAGALAACAAVARFTARPRFTPVLGGLAVAAWLGLLAMWLLREVPRPVVILVRATPLRAGNAESYPAVVALPAGAEAQPTFARGGWLRVALADGRVGWLPEAAVLHVP